MSDIKQHHVQTITHGFVGDVSTYYYRDCSCGWEGPPRHTVGEVMDFDSCPRAKVAAPPATTPESA